MLSDPVIAALHLVLFTDGGREIDLNGLLTWALLIGAGYGALRLVFDVFWVFARPKRRKA
jgi:hypothetical protein